MPFRLTQINKKRAYEEIVELIWKAIEENQASPGDRLPSENKLSSQLGVARPTLREALSVLHYLGVIESVQGGGYYVKALKPPDLTGRLVPFSREVSPYDVITARLTLEPEAAGLAAGMRKDEDVNSLLVILEQIKDPVSPGEYPRHLDNNFHNLIAKTTDNPLLISMVDSLLALRDRTLYKIVLMAGYGTERYLADVRRDHMNIYLAIRDRDPDKARAAMKTHLQNVKRQVFGENGE